VKKTENADIIRTVDAVKAMIEESKTMIAPGSIDFLFTADESIGVHDKFEIVKSNGFMGLILVVVVLALFLNIRSSIWVALGIPVSLLGVLAVLPFFDVELDSLTMAAMVLVLGIIVDDAIVITENIFQHREQGESPLEAAVNGLYEVALPVLTTVVTTILAFVPMLFIKGMLGKFIFVIPITVILSLTISMFESYFILPAHLLPGLQGGKKKTVGRTWFNPIRDAFERALPSLLNLRYVLAFVACLLLGGSLLYAKNSLKFVLTVRSANIESITIRVNMPIGTSLEATSDTMRKIEAIIEKLPEGEIDSYFAQIGTGGRHASKSSHLATLTLDLAPLSQFQRPFVELQSELRQKIKAIKGIKSFSMGFSTKGPPTGEPVEVMVKGANDTLRSQFANEIIAFLNTLEGVSDVERDDKLGKDEISLQINYPLLSRYGLTVADVSQTVRIAYDGQVATTTRYGDEDIDFRVILQREYRKDMEYLKQLKIPNKQGEFINLEEVATFHVGPGVYAFYHDSGERTITVTGELNDKVITSLEVMNALKEHARSIFSKYPGIRIDIGGEAEESRQAMQDILFSFALAALGIYFLLMVLFESLTQPFIVLISVPFGIAGVVLALALHGVTQPSFFTGIGIVGLAGVVVNDALVMVDHLNALRRKHSSQKMVALIAQGTANRLRPVLLTTVTTVAGLLPLTYGIGGEDAMMGPMAMALGYGLLFATPVTLVLLPCLYMIWDDIQRSFSRFSRKPSTTI
jgi:multidrug efflux pump subunit AcrB